MELSPLGYALVGAAIVIVLIAIGAAADWGLRKRIKNEVSKRLRARTDMLREQANQGMGFQGFDPGEPDCQDCPETEGDDDE